MDTTRFRSPSLLAASLAVIVSACGGSDSDSSADEPDPPIEAGDGSDDTTATEPSGDGGLGTDDVGRGILRIDGVEYDSFTGDCEIARGAGSEDVGDLSVDGLSTIVAIDNVAAGDPDTLDDDLNFIMTNQDMFRVRNTQRGTIESIQEVGARTSDGSRDYVVVAFSGVLNEGGQVEAEVVCELQNQF